jgi:hypothetical protein
MGKLAPDADNLMLGKGKLYWKRFNTDGSAPPDWYLLGNCDTVEIGMNDDVLEKRSSMDAAAGILKRITKNRSVEVSIKGNDYALMNMALTLMGNESTLAAQTGGAVVSEALSGAANLVLGAVYKTANRQISAVAVKQGATTLVLGTDYEILSAEIGLIRIKPTSVTADEAAAVTVDYTGAAIAADTVKTLKGATETQIEGALMFVGDPTSGPRYQVEFWYVSSTPDGTVPLIQDDWGEWGLKMAVQDDSTGQYGGSAGEPYFRVTELAA